MILFPIKLTAATARRTAVASELSPKPLQPCEVRNLVLKPLFIALLTIREAERLRYLCFNFKTNDKGELIYKRVSCDLGNAIRDLNKELTGGMFGAELQLMQFLEYRFFEDTKKVFSLLRLNVEEFIRSLNYDVDDSDINAQSEVVRFLSLMAIEFAEEYTERLAAACAEVPLKITPLSINNLVAIQKACIAIEEKSVAAQVNEVNKRKRAALEACIDAAIRELKSISVAQADKFRCCGVCANYRYEVAAKGRCKWPSYNASQMRPACKRFKRVNDKTELYNNYSAKGVNIK